ncbi:MAG TPA: 30S ribosomal protein S16, partial [Gammaproteobacteria bacterium]|nr:30S ribosomal protein S16 [Gammaproteobacteria bacterium]
IVVTDSRRARDGRFIERIGYFNPIATGGERRLVLDSDRAAFWQARGAQLSQRVAALVKESARPAGAPAVEPPATPAEAASEA